jgi:hypothetical protein
MMSIKWIRVPALPQSVEQEIRNLGITKLTGRVQEHPCWVPGESARGRPPRSGP